MPYWRLSLFYFFYFAGLGAFIAFWGLYLKAEGLTELDIGGLLAVFVGTRIFSPLLLAYLVDRTQRPVLALKISVGLMLLCFAGLMLSSSLIGKYLWVFGFGFFFSGILPKFEALTLKFIAEQLHRYTLIRLWGSIGFAVAVLVLGVVLEYIAIAHLSKILFILLLGLAVTSFSLQEIKLEPSPEVTESFWSILLSPKVKLFLLVAFLMQLSHGAYYAFFSIYLAEFSYSKSQIGLLWTIGVIAEILLFIYLPKFKTGRHEHKLVSLALVLTVGRWCMTAVFADNIFILSLVQLLHAASFALFHALAVQHINRIFTKDKQARGQAIYSMASFGAGGMLGSMLAGYAWQFLGGQLIFVISALFVVLGTFIWRQTSL